MSLALVVGTGSVTVIKMKRLGANKARYRAKRGWNRKGFRGPLGALSDSISPPPYLYVEYGSPKGKAFVPVSKSLATNHSNVLLAYTYLFILGNWLDLGVRSRDGKPDYVQSLLNAYLCSYLVEKPRRKRNWSISSCLHICRVDRTRSQDCLARPASSAQTRQGSSGRGWLDETNPGSFTGAREPPPFCPWSALTGGGSWAPSWLKATYIHSVSWRVVG